MTQLNSETILRKEEQKEAERVSEDGGACPGGQAR